MKHHKLTIDLSGQKFGKWIVVERVMDHDKKTRQAVWLCRCDCGKTKTVTSDVLRRGSSQSCGCDRARSRRLNLSGKRFGRLLVIQESTRSSSNIRRWLCLCDCGEIKVVRQTELTTGGTRSCGCLKSDAHTKHGLSKTSAYSSWRSMMKRCYVESSISFPSYGGRGIKVCEEWHEVENFVKDMGERPENMTLDRLDNNKNYEPSNCRWATAEQQQENRRSTKLTKEKAREIKDSKERIKDLAKKYGVAGATISSIRTGRNWRYV